MDYNSFIKENKPLILIVDDMPINIKMLETILKKNGYSFDTASNGNQALEKVKKNNPDLILLDINMPELDGFSVCEKLKASEKTSQIPVFFLTAKAETEDIVKGFEVGAADYITKPFNPQELLSRIKTHLLLKKALDDIKKFERQNTINAMAITANHEINQPLTILQGNIEIFTKSFNPANLSDKQKKYLQKMEQAIKRIEDILKKFQDSRSSTIEKYIKDKKMIIFDE